MNSDEGICPVGGGGDLTLPMAELRQKKADGLFCNDDTFCLDVPSSSQAWVHHLGPMCAPTGMKR